MAVIIDIGEADDIHPRNKQDVGRRLARWALADTYGQDLVKSGPLYASSAVEGDSIIVRFEHAGGLTTADGEAPRGFAIAGADRVWQWAEARIDGHSVVVRSAKVPRPVAVRYAWADNPEATLRNAEGLPASPFRTDDWPAITAPKEMADGRALVRAMHARYAGRWYRNLMLVQDVTYFENGSADRTEQMAEYLTLPGRVRAITGDIASGDAEIYVDGAFHRFEDGRMTSRLPTVHGVLLLGFDVYTQVPETSIAQLEELGVDLDRITEGPGKAVRGGWSAPARGFERPPVLGGEGPTALLASASASVPTGPWTWRWPGWEPLDDGWIATELTFKRDGVLAAEGRLRRVPDPGESRPGTVRRDRAADRAASTLIAGRRPASTTPSRSSWEAQPHESGCTWVS